MDIQLQILNAIEQQNVLLRQFLKKESQGNLMTALEVCSELGLTMSKSSAKKYMLNAYKDGRLPNALRKGMQLMITREDFFNLKRDIINKDYKPYTNDKFRK